MTENSTNDQSECRAKRHFRRGGGWIGGAILVLLGLLLLGQNMNIAPFDKWWALFILLPAFGSFSAAWRMYQSAGRLTRRVRGAIIVGIVLTLVTAMFLFDVNWTYIGPGLLILAGVSILINVLLPD
jgi:uncharacterized membrane protein YbaN (DUF454 family)